VTETEAAIVRRVDELQPWLVEQARALIAIPTVNPYAGDPEAPGEAAGQAWIESRLRELGGRVRRIPVPSDIYARYGLIGPPGRQWNGRENVVAEWDFGAGGPVVLLNTHMDTVGTAGMAIPPFEPTVRDGFLYGRGSSDSKGNLAMDLAVIRALLEGAPPTRGRLVFESVVDEECSGGGAGTLACCAAGVTADLALVTDGARGTVAIRCNGLATLWLTVYGRAGHSSLNTAVSAIDKGIFVKTALDAFMEAYGRRYPGCRGTVGVFRAGTLPSMVPGEARIGVNLKYSIEDARAAEREGGAWTGQRFRNQFEQWLAEALCSDPWLAHHPPSLEWTADMTPFETPPDHPCVRMTLAAAREATGETPTAGTMPAWFDGARLAMALRIPVIGLGHGELGQAHSASERVPLANLKAGSRTLALLLVRLFNTWPW
jgi:acetylornithine deacetylase/succinyl-diaminopimelate desuccinylase-like protein